MALFDRPKVPPLSERVVVPEYPVSRYSFFNQEYIPTGILMNGIESPCVIEKFQRPFFAQQLAQLRQERVKTSDGTRRRQIDDWMHAFKKRNISSPLETAHFHNGVFLRTPQSTKTPTTCQDRAAISCDVRGDVKMFALADGVSSVRFGGQNAQVAVDEAMRYLMNTSSLVSMTDRVKNAPLLLQQRIRQRYLRTLRIAGLQEAISTFSSAEEHSEYERVFGLTARDVGATTLLTGVLEKNILHLSCLADGGFVILGKDGTIKKSVGDAFCGQLSFNTDGLARYFKPSTPERSEQFGSFDIPLADGDIFIGYSDGLFENAVVGLPGADSSPVFSQEQLARAFAQGVKEKRPLEEILRERFGVSLGIDDCSALVFQYVK